MTKRFINPIEARHQIAAAKADEQQAARRAELERERQAKLTQQRATQQAIESSRKKPMTEEEALAWLRDYVKNKKR